MIGTLLFVPGREIDLEGGAFAEAAGHRDPALMLLDNAINRGQAQARAAAQFLGGEKRLEDAAQILRRNAAAGVAEGQADETRRAPPSGLSRACASSIRPPRCG